MSTGALIAKLEDDGKLFRFSPGLRRPFKRRLYLTTAAHREFEDQNSAVNMLVGKGYIKAAMTKWVSGGLVNADDKGKPRFLKELDGPPFDVWEMRVYDPSPQARVIGGFLERDTLIICRLHTRPHLGKKASLAWQEAMSQVITDFGTLFGRSPFHAKTVGDYISENFDDFKLKR